MKKPPLSPRDLAYGGLFGAAALLLPTVFHLLHLGHVFMPMYLPLVALAFFAGPLASMGTALLVPLLSGALTGMPPFYPPVAPIMAIELPFMAGLIGLARKISPGLSPSWILPPVLLFGRILGFALIYAFAAVMDLPAAYVAGASLISGWPGIILIFVTIPPLVHITRQFRHRTLEERNAL